MPRVPKSNSRSFSDSEVSRRKHKKADSKKKRTKHNSESHRPIHLTLQQLAEFRNNYMKNVKQVSTMEREVCDNKAYSPINSQLKMTEIGVKIKDQIECLASDSCELQKIEGKNETSQQSLEENSLQNEDSEDTSIEPDNRVSAVEGISTQCGIYGAPFRSSPTPGEDKNGEKPILLQAVENSTIKGASTNNLIEEPECLSPKETAKDDIGNDELDIEFEITGDLDDDDDLLSEQQVKVTKKKEKVPPNPNDMFLDDDPDDATEVKTIPYVNLTDPSTDVPEWECPILDILEREEGELTPDLYSSDICESKDLDAKIKASRESNIEFFNKVNKCFRQLEKEFGNMHVPHGSKRLVAHLQSTLNSVDRMQRKLSFLINSTKIGNDNGSTSGKSHSRNQEKRTSPKTSATGNRNPSDHTRGENGDPKNRSRSKSQARDRQRGQNENGAKENKNPELKQSDHSRSQSLYKHPHSERNPNEPMRVHSGPKEAMVKMIPQVLRTPTTAGTRKERQRIQSLFKRQMNLITQHVIQKNDPNKSGKSSGAKYVHNMARGEKGHLKVGKIETLDDMEAFLQILKAKKGQKGALLDSYAEDCKKRQGLFKFTTKKEKDISQTRRTFPTLLTEAKHAQYNVISPRIQAEKIPKNNPRESTHVTAFQSKKRHEKTSGEKSKPDKDMLKSTKEFDVDDLLEEQLKKSNSSTTTEFRKSDLSRRSYSQEQKDAKSTDKWKKVGSVPREEIEFKRGENAPFSKKVIDSLSVKRNSREIERIKPLHHLRSSDFADDSKEIIRELSKKRKRSDEEYSKRSKSSESDSDVRRERRDEILKKRKRNDSDDSRGKLSSAMLKKYSQSEKKYRTRHRSDVSSVIDNLSGKLPKELISKKLFILGDKNLAIVDKHFCLKVKGNQIYLKKVGRMRGSRGGSEEQRNSRPGSRESNKCDWEMPVKGEKYKRIDRERRSDSEKVGTTLQEMEDFLQKLRSKKKISSEERHDLPLPNQQTREMKFLARIQAKRKAKLMACVSGTPSITEKEAKFLKDLENGAQDPSDSPETESKKQKLMQKIRAETDAIVLAQKNSFKNSTNPDDDPLSDVKNFLNMLKEAESANDEKSKQFYVSFSMKKSDVKELENITNGTASALTEESQRFLNSVRAKIRAKKTSLSQDFPDNKD